MLLPFLLTASPVPRPMATAAEVLARHDTQTAAFARSIERAVAGGFLADRLGYAFISGYREALRVLVGDGATKEPAALCATEEGGAHPRAIMARLNPAAEPQGVWELSGRKNFVTLGNLARVLFVVAVDGTDAEGRNRLVLVYVPADRSGVTVKPLPDLPFVPEIPHASVEFASVRIAAAERLPGDGYERYLKPFRTVEDCHVMAAYLGWLVQVARRCAWPATVLQELLALIGAGCELGSLPPLDFALHLALGGWLQNIERLTNDCSPLWERALPDERTRWERDRPLLRVAAKVRARRLEAAWTKVGTV
jgi:hypothetical protein